VGLTFGWGGQERLLKKVSSKNLQNWLLEASTYSSYQAKRVGLVDQICLSSNLMKEALKWIGNIEKRGPQSLQTILENSEDQKSAFKSLWLGEEHKKALGKIKA
jgi:enoyl-CoA hydratase/carnithine racemase